MRDWHLSTPVAFIIFNRPETAARVFAAIAEARPPRLLVIADGPRASHPGEAHKCAATRALIDKVDWDCDVATLFADVNMGCKLRVSSGLDWVFGREEEAIILEDDCLPHPTFFRYCEDLLERYRQDDRVAQISGSCLQGRRSAASDRYYFSHYSHVWGWASWARAWRQYDVDMGTWPALRNGGWLHGVLDDRRQERYWRHVFDKVAAGKIDTWDYQWTFACWVMGGLCALPNVNLISNIGFGPDSSHTRSRSPFADLPTESMSFPLRHPDLVQRDVAADAFTNSEIYKPLFPRLVAKARRDPKGFAHQAWDKAKGRFGWAPSR